MTTTLTSDVNTTLQQTFDLSGWRVNGLGYTFPPGSILLPRAYLVLAENRAEFVRAYGNADLVFDDFDGTLDPDGNLLEKETRLIVKAMVGLMNITCKHAGR